jgi:hypothetical protein
MDRLDLSHEREHLLSSTSTGIRLPNFWALIAVLVTLIGALFSAVPLLTQFSSYDDEGYMLESLDHYINAGHLYTLTFSQYGPFYYYAQGIFFQLLHLPVTHDMGRLVTLIYWVAASLLAVIFVYRLCKSLFLACAAGLCCMVVARVLCNEPGHPQQVVLDLYLIAACLSLPSSSGRNNLRLFLLGCVGAAMAFTKVNVGVFFVAGLVHTIFCLFPRGRIRSIGLALTLTYAAAGPWMLMHASFNHGFRGYCLLATVAGIVTFACCANVTPSNRLPIQAALCSATGLLAGTAAIIAAAALQGMSPGSLVWGVILNPLHQPNLFSFPLHVSQLNWIAALILTVVVIGLKTLGRPVTESPWFDLLRFAVGAGSILLLILRAEIQWVVPLLPLTVLPGPSWKLDAGTTFRRLFVTCMAATQFLEPYPVAGSQVGIAAAPMILWGFLCLADGLPGLRQLSSRYSRDFAKALRLDALIGSAIILLCTGTSVAHAIHLRPRLAWTALKSRTWPASNFPPASTGLKGSEWLHLSPEQTAQFRSIARLINANCGILFTMPGMYSFNIWSGVPTPNGWNHDGWMGGISLDRQTEILNIMKADPQACAILNRNLVRFWDEDDAGVAVLPLAHYIMTDMPKVAEFGEYEIRVQPHRSSPWLQ